MGEFCDIIVLWSIWCKKIVTKSEYFGCVQFSSKNSKQMTMTIDVNDDLQNSIQQEFKIIAEL